MPMWDWGYTMGWPMVLWMILMMLGGFALLALLIWALVRRATPPEPTRNDASALDILRARYARGEVDGATFEEMRERLETAYK
jgi:putative membrane protein